MRKKNYAMFLTAAMMLALGMPTLNGDAANILEMGKEQIETNKPRYEIAKDISANFSIDNNTAKLSLLVNAPSTKSVSIKMILQRKDGDSWTKVQTWNKAGTGRQNLSKSMVVTKDRKYRMKYTVTVGSETVTDKTPAKTA